MVYVCLFFTHSNAPWTDITETSHKSGLYTQHKPVAVMKVGSDGLNLLLKIKRIGIFLNF